MQAGHFSPPPDLPDRDLEVARQQARDGRTAEAEQTFDRVLQAQPDNVEALRFLAGAAHARGDEGRAVALLSRATKAAPDNAGVQAELGIAYRAAERFDAARYVLERAARLSAGRNPSIRLLLANVLELDQRPELALLHYFRAMIEARQAQRWADPGDKLPEQRALVEHAERYVKTERRAWFERVLAPFRRSPGTSLDRIDAALAIYLGERQPVFADSRQQAGFMYVPALQTARFLDPAGFPWLANAATSIAAWDGEMDACMAASAAAPPVAHGTRRVSVLQRGIPQYEARRYAPHLLLTLAELPLACVPNHAPDADIIALDANAQLPLHYGRSNSRCRAIINLSDSAPLQIIGGGESRVLAARDNAVVDPSFGVEYRNNGATRILAVAFDVWHPDLTALEQQTLSALLVAAVDFDTRLQDLS